ncbi:MAG: hypothetical protein DRN96_04715 [Thermoproteota archaeon]|nr:MAG: hypothetical protein DRN96_04715 [Candidatus Korarchaeota archaeon]
MMSTFKSQGLAPLGASMRLQAALLAVLLALLAASSPPPSAAQAPLLWVYDAGEDVTSVDMSLNGSVVAYASLSKVGVISQSGSLLWSAPANPTTARRGVCISPDGGYMLIVNSSRVALYTTSGTMLWEQSYAPYAPIDISVSLGASISAVVESNKLHIYDKNGNEMGQVLAESGNLMSVDVSRNGARVAAGGDVFNKKVYMCDPNGTLKWTPYDTSWEVVDVELNPSGLFLAAASSSVYFFDLAGFKWNSTEIDANSVSVSFTSSYIAVGAPAGLYLYTKYGIATTWSNPPYGEVLSVDISADGSLIAAGGRNGVVYLFSRDTGLLWMYSTGSAVKQIAISDDGSRIVAMSGRKIYYFSSQPGELDLLRYPEPFVAGGVLNVTFIIGDSTPHGFYGIGAATMDVGGAIAIAGSLGVEASGGVASWGLDTWYAEWDGSNVTVDWSSMPKSNIIYVGGPGVNMFSWLFDSFNSCPFYAVLIDGVPYLHSDITGADYGSGSGYDHALIALHYHEGRYHLLAWGLTANGTAAACQVLQYYRQYPSVLEGRAVILRWEDTNGNGRVDPGDTIEDVEHWSVFTIQG